MKKRENTVKIVPIYYCKRCDKDDNKKDSWVPCPRGGCEAEVVGHKRVEKFYVYEEDIIKNKM